MPDRPKPPRGFETWLDLAVYQCHWNDTKTNAAAELAELRSRPTWDEVIDGVREFCTERHVGEMTVRCDCMHMIAAVRKRKEAHENPDPRTP